MRAEQRERLIDAAAEMMRRRGYAAVGVTEVCKAAGVSRAQFYRLFEAKRDLGVAVLRRYSEERQRMLDRALPDQMPVRGQIQRMFSMLHQEQTRARAEIGRTPGSLFALFVDDGEDDPILRAAIEEGLAAWRARLTRIFTDAHDRGEIRLSTPEYPAQAIVAFAEGALQVARVSDDPDVVLRLAPASMSLLIDRRATGAWPLVLASSGEHESV